MHPLAHAITAQSSHAQPTSHMPNHMLHYPPCQPSTTGFCVHYKPAMEQLLPQRSSCQALAPCDIPESCRPTFCQLYTKNYNHLQACITTHWLNLDQLWPPHGARKGQDRKEWAIYPSTYCALSPEQAQQADPHVSSSVYCRPVPCPVVC